MNAADLGMTPPLGAGGASVELQVGDCLLLLGRLPTASFDWVLTSPPYNVGKSYERRTSMAAYQQWIQPITVECVRTLAHGGSVFWQVGNHVRGGEVLPLDFVFIPMFQALGLTLRHRIVWRFGHGLHCKRRFSGRHETILWFTKGQPHRDVSTTREALGSVWDIPNIGFNNREKTAHPCQFPLALVQRLLETATRPGSRGVDPFAGSGTTGVAAREAGRSVVLMEQEPQFATIIRKRVGLSEAGSWQTAASSAQMV